MNNTTVLIKELRQATGAGFLDCKQALAAHHGDVEQAAAFLRKKNLKKAIKKTERPTSEGLVVVKTNTDSVCAVVLNCETDFVALTPDFKVFAHNLADLVLSDAALTTTEDLDTAVFPSNPHQHIHAAINGLIGKLGENIKLGQVVRYTVTPTTVIHSFVHAGAISGYGQDEGRLAVLVELSVADKTTVSEHAIQTIAHDLALHIGSAAPKYISIADIPLEVLVEKQEQLKAQVVSKNKSAVIKEKIIAGRLSKFYRENCLLLQPFSKRDTVSVADWLAAESRGLGTAVSITRFARLAIGTQ